MKVTYKLLLPHLQGLSGENKTNLALVCLQGGDIVTSFFFYIHFYFKSLCCCFYRRGVGD
jgi:hypothetical protein